MEKLIVKNFGPIKEAEIDLTKYVVFIGDTSTGKSVLAKLIAIFRDSFNFLSIQKDIQIIDFKKELKKYNINFNFDDSEIIYFGKKVNSNDYIKLLELKKDKIRLLNETNKEEFLKLFDNIQNETFEKLSLPTYIDFKKEQFLEIFYNDFFKSINSTYFPAERILYSLTGNSLSGLMANNVALPDCYKEFAAKYEVARKEISQIKYTAFNIEYNFENGLDEIYFGDNKILLNEASSGIQSLIPLLIVLENEISKNDFDTGKFLILEEPELNLFPIKQKRLIDHISLKTNNTKHKIVITTHSPYILSALDTLILAKNTFNEHPDLKGEINSIVSEDKWIDYEDISVYEVRNDGKVYSIKNEEFRSIDTNAIDGVSDIISEEFDKLTELRYAQ
ncbi:AAA family ATPase [Flavobacterium sp. MC2016-06]|jgi:predicted ATPase|uniref:AAA family ATPase n=1 Tax=Flavobacterium sp. MC2016-06 TaxID=2676308 RepID=UPI0012BA6608|nr:AAA family ATPase [Flavobacterium sp. MC2016-06]MBU3859401.1 ATP-binding protein [Flavobacterium sp. MC2016-06]